MPKPLGTYALISSTTLGSNGQVEFTNIPLTYTDLIIVGLYGTVTTAHPLTMQVGNTTLDTGTNYSNTVLYGNGTSAGSYRDSVSSIGAGTYYVGAASSLENTTIIHLMDYSNTTTNKTVLTRSGGASREAEVGVSLWRSTVAINRIKLGAATGLTNNLLSGSTFKLYGILAGNQ